jgi:predicted nucleic acid-binding protein
MKRVFADSFYFFAVLNKNELQHERAKQFAATFPGGLVTTDWVLTEIADGLARPPRREVFTALHDELVAHPYVQIIPCSSALHDAGLNLYRAHPDKAWSLTDCISFVVMEREGIAEALTGDRHFEQAGFAALLK